MIKVVCAVILKGDLLLLTQRLPPHPLAGLWNLPGGKVDKGESEVEALQRELDEELGLTAVSISPKSRVAIRVSDLLPVEFELVAYRVMTTKNPVPMEDQPMGWFSDTFPPTITQSNRVLLQTMKRITWGRIKHKPIRKDS